MAHQNGYAKKALGSFLAFVLAVSLLPVLPATAVADAGELPPLRELDTKTFYGGYKDPDFGAEYDLIEGRVDTGKANGVHYFYSDGYFAGDPETYNEHLATMGLNMAVAAYGNNSFENPDGSTDYTHHPQSVLEVMAGSGFENLYANHFYMEKPTTDSIGVAISSKEVQLQNSNGVRSPRKVIAVAIRGGSYESEWASNVTLGKTSEGEAHGFASAADIVENEIEGYIDNNGLRDEVEEGHAIFWVVGYSRAGATANLTSKRLIDLYQGANDKIFGYCYEPPQGGRDDTETPGSNYKWIHNIVNYSDVVTMVAPTSMGFKRYGVDHYVPGYYKNGKFSGYEVKVGSTKYDNGKRTITTTTDNLPLKVNQSAGSDYQKQVALMKIQLQDCDENFKFDDSFQMAEIEIFKNFGTPKIDPLRDSGKVDLHDYCEMLLEKLQEWAVVSRTFYSSTTIFTYYWDASTNFETAARYFIKLFMDTSGKKDEGVINCLKGLKDNLSKTDMISIYLDIRSWNTMDKGMRNLYRYSTISKLWDVLVDTSKQENLTKYLSTSELKQFKKAFFTMANVLFRFVCEDLDTDANDVFSDKSRYGSVSSETTALMGTAAYLGGKLVQPHMEMLNLAWLRSYDSFYQDKPTGPTTDGQYKVHVERAQKKDGAVVYGLEELAFNPGDFVSLDTVEMDGKQLVCWSEGRPQDTTMDSTASLPEGFYDGGMQCTFIMPEHTVYLKASYSDVQLFDQVDIKVKTELENRVYEGFRGYDFSYAISRSTDDTVIRGTGGTGAGYSVTKLIASDLGNAAYEVAECQVDLHDYQKYFKDGLPNVLLNGKSLMDIANVKSLEDLSHAGKIENVGQRSGDRYFLTFYLLQPPATITGVKDTIYYVPEGTSASKLTEQLPEKVTVHTNAGDVQRPVTWPNFPEKLDPSYNGILGHFDTYGLEKVSDWDDEVAASFWFYKNTATGTAVRTGTDSYTVTLSTNCYAPYTIYYTTDGSDPAENQNYQYTGPITLSSDTRVRAVAFRNETDPRYPYLPGVAFDHTFQAENIPFDSFTITYDLGSDPYAVNSSKNPATWNAVSPDITLDDPILGGYRFEGWYKERTFDTKVETLVAAEAADITLYAKWAKDPNYLLDRDLQVTLAGWTYGDDPKTPTVQGDDTASSTVTFYYKETSQLDTAYTTTVPTNAGEYMVKAVAEATDHYKAAEATAVFTIAQATTTIENKFGTYTYDGRYHTYEWTIEGPTEEECTFTYSLREDFKFVTQEKPYFTEPGEYTFYTRIASRNYQPLQLTCKVTISRSESCDFELMARNSVYGDDVDISFYTASAGLDIAIFFKPQSAGDDAWTTEIPRDAGAYDVKAELGDDVRYKKTTQTKQFTISKRNVTYSPAPGQKKYYGDNDPKIGVVYDGLVDDIKPGALLDREAGENVGTYNYKVLVAPSVDTENYNYIFEAGEEKFTVNQKPLSMVESAVAYDEKTDTLTISAVDGDYTLVENTDFTVEKGMEGDSMVVTLTAPENGNYSGKITAAVPMEAKVECTKYADQGLYLVRYYDTGFDIDDLITCNGEDMYWMPTEQCWAVVMDKDPTVNPDADPDDPSINPYRRPEFRSTGRTGQEVIFPGNEGPGTAVAGDLNENGLLNIVDVQIAYDMATNGFKLADLPQMAWLKADVTRDAYLDALDARAIQVAVIDGWPE